MDPVMMISIGVGILLAMLVSKDAKKLKANGAKITPGMWAVCTFLLWPIALVYLIVRNTKYKNASSASAQ